MSGIRKELGGIVYLEWLFLIRNYYSMLKNNEITFEVLIPITMSTFCVSTYWARASIQQALESLSRLLPTAVSVLIGFSVLLITILLTSNGENIRNLKNNYLRKKSSKPQFSLYQALLAQFAHLLCSEIVLMIVIFIALFWEGLGIIKWAAALLLWAEIYLTLNVLLSVLRGVTNIYFSFFK